MFVCVLTTSPFPGDHVGDGGKEEGQAGNDQQGDDYQGGVKGASLGLGLYWGRVAIARRRGVRERRGLGLQAVGGVKLRGCLDLVVAVDPGEEADHGGQGQFVLHRVCVCVLA